MKNYKLNYSVKADKLKLVKKFVTVAAIAFLTTGAPVATAVLNAAGPAPVAQPLAYGVRIQTAAQNEITDLAKTNKPVADLLQKLLDNASDLSKLTAAEKLAIKTGAGVDVASASVWSKAAIFNTAYAFNHNGKDISQESPEVRNLLVAAEAKDQAYADKVYDTNVKTAQTALDTAKADLKAAQDAKKPAAEIAALQAKEKLAEAKLELATAVQNAKGNTKDAAVVAAQGKVTTAQTALSALPATNPQAPAANGQAPAGQIDVDKLVADYFNAKNKLSDEKYDLENGVPGGSQAKVDDAQKAFDTAKTNVAKNAEAQKQVNDAEAAKAAAILQTQQRIAAQRVITAQNRAAVAAAQTALNTAKANLKAAQDAKKPAAEIASLQSKLDLAQAKYDLAKATQIAVSNLNDPAVKAAQDKVTAAQKAVDALPATNTQSQVPANPQVPAANGQQKAPTAQDLLKNLVSSTQGAADAGKAVKDATAALKAAQDAKKPAAEIATLQAKLDLANAKYQLADAQVKAGTNTNDPAVKAAQDKVTNAQKAVDALPATSTQAANGQQKAPTAQELLKNLVSTTQGAADAGKAVKDANAALKAAQDAKKPAAEIAALQAKVALANAKYQLADAQVKAGTNTNDPAVKAAQDKVVIAQKDFDTKAATLKTAQAAAKAAADKAYAAAHPAFKVFVNGKQVTNGNYTNRATYRLNAGVARATHLNGGVVRINKTRTGYTLSGLRASRGFKITSIRMWKGANGTFGFNVSTAKVINLTVNAHFGRHSKVVGHGEFANNARTRVNARGYHFHGRAKVVITTRRHRTTTKVVGLSADRHYKITRITISNSHGNKVVNVTVKKR